jgi:histidinol-phosphate/aromatic aminotransferase/cobyric acid decarboxylase-like protein
LSAKIKGGQYIRLAVRDKKDDDRLLEALGKILG